jgi:catechol 2,3-dioxygenase-like lactoylglutathione lyase family enzyme
MLLALTIGGIMQTNASAKGGPPTAPDPSAVTVRYQVSAVEPSVNFYTQQLGFKLDQHTGPFAQVSRGKLVLILSGPGTSGARPMPDGRKQEPGGWNRIVLYVDDLHGTIEKLKSAGVRFRNQVEVGPGGSQILIEDPDGNPIELHEPPRATR